jgi:hypothetical protein
VKTHEQKTEDFAMSWENVRAIFPYGLPASLQGGDQQSSYDSNVVDFEQWCRRHRKEMATRRRSWSESVD